MKQTFTRCMALSLLVFLFSLTGHIYAQSGVAPGNKSVAGAWKVKAGDEKFTLNTNGTSLYSYQGRECPGTWTVEGKKLIINPRKLGWHHADPCSKTRTFEIVGHTVNNMTITETETKRTINLENQE